MDYIFVHNQAEVTTDRAGGRLSWISGTHERTALQHRAITRDDHLHDRTGSDVGDKAIVEGLAFVLLIVRCCLLGRDITELHALDRKASALEAIDDLANVTISDAIGLIMM